MASRAKLFFAHWSLFPLSISLFHVSIPDTMDISSAKYICLGDFVLAC